MANDVLLYYMLLTEDRVRPNNAYVLWASD